MLIHAANPSSPCSTSRLIGSLWAAVTLPVNVTLPAAAVAT